MAQGYYQIELEEDSRKKTAFITKYGLFEDTRMGFGLTGAPAAFQRASKLVLRGLTWTEVLTYLDDVIALGKSVEEHLASLKRVFGRFHLYNLKLKPKKWYFLCSEIEFLGKLVTREGIGLSPSKKDVVASWPQPTTKKELESFLGYANYHRAYVKQNAQLTAPLYHSQTN